MENNEARMAEVEAAYNSILMKNMQMRLSGSIKADASIKNADNVYVHRHPPLQHPPHPPVPGRGLKGEPRATVRRLPKRR